MEDLERALTVEEDIVPSFGFTRAVMEAVRRETSEPTPIPFPWKRALPGLLLVALVVITLVFVPAPINRSGQTELPTIQLTAMLKTLQETMGTFYLRWLLGSLLLTWACVNLSIRLASWRS